MERTVKVGTVSTIKFMSLAYDIIIVGGGMVGGALACALGNSDYRVAVIEAGSVPTFSPSDPMALRVSALSIASQLILTQVGAWRGIIDRRACPYRRMLIWDGNGRSETQFNSAEIAQPHLGHIVENSVIQLALCEQLQSYSHIDFFTQVCIEALLLNDKVARVTLQDGRTLETKLLVGADGGNSKVRSLASIEVDQCQYTDQHALVASIATELPQQDITWQRFVTSGPQAFLPLTGQRGSVVWYNTPDQVAYLKALSEEDFVEQLQQTFPQRLGKITSLHARGSFPLAKMHARRYVKPRVALIGDAAHTVHPLAGQGVNLGLLDAACLAEVLIEHPNPRDPGELGSLRRYERWRKGYNHLMQSSLDGFYHIFKPQNPILRTLRGAALSLANDVRPLNRLLMRYACGVIGDLPKLAKGYRISRYTMESEVD